MSLHHRSGGPPPLMDDVSDFDRNMHSNRFEGGRGGGRGRGGGGMRGRGDGSGGMRGRGGDGGFGSRGGSRGGGRGDFHPRDRFNNNNFNRPFDDQRGGSGDGNQPKMPSLFDIDQTSMRPFDRDSNRGGGRGRMPFPRGEGGRSSTGDDRYHQSGSKQSPTDLPPPLLDFGKEKSGLPANASNNSLPSLLSVQVEGSAAPPPGSEPSKSLDSHKEHQHSDSLNARSESHSSFRDSEGRFRDRDSHKPNRGGFNRSQSFNRDRSRSPRDRDRERDRDRDRHGPPRDDRRGGRGGGRGGGDRGGGRGGHHNNPRESRFGSDNNQPPWHDRREGGRGGGGRGGFHDRQHDMGGHYRSNEQLPPENNPFSRDGRPPFDGPPPLNRPFQENFPLGNYDSMGPNSHNRGNMQQPSNYNQGSTPNRPDFYPANANNQLYQQHNTRSGGRPSRFSDRQDDYDDDRPLTKPNFSLPNVTTTTAPLYMNQPTNPTFSQARPSLSTTYSSHQPPSAMFPSSMPPHNVQQSPFGWPNQQQQPAPPQQGPPNSHMNQSLLSLASNDQQNQNMPGPQPPNSFYGGNNDFHRQQQQQPSVNPYYSGVPPVPSQSVNKPQNANIQNSAASVSAQSSVPPIAGVSSTAANASSTDPWQQYYQQYWQYMQQQQQQQVAVQPVSAQQPIPQLQAGSATGVKQPTNTTTAATGNAQDASTNQANTNAWAQYWVQYQAYLQQQQQQQQQQPQVPPVTATSTTSPATITAPSQLYPQPIGKQPLVASGSSANASGNAAGASNWQQWFNAK